MQKSTAQNPQGVPSWPSLIRTTLGRIPKKGRGRGCRCLVPRASKYASLISDGLSVKAHAGTFQLIPRRILSHQPNEQVERIRRRQRHALQFIRRYGDASGNAAECSVRSGAIKKSGQYIGGHRGPLDGRPDHVEVIFDHDGAMAENELRGQSGSYKPTVLFLGRRTLDKDTGTVRDEPIVSFANFKISSARHTKRPSEVTASAQMSGKRFPPGRATS